MTAAEICLYVSRIAKGGTSMTAIAGQCLNIVLENLWQVYDLKINRVTAAPVIQPATYGPFDLPVKYARPYDVFYPLPASGGATNSSMTQFLVMITMEQFDAEFKSPSISNYPYEMATDLSEDAIANSATGAGQFFVYPQCSGAITLTFRYMLKHDPITNPETSSVTPWFANSKYLTTAAAAEMFGITGDDRKAQYDADAMQILRPYLIQAADDEGQAVYNVRLDPRHWHFNKGARPTKASPL